MLENLTSSCIARDRIPLSLLSSENQAPLRFADVIALFNSLFTLSGNWSDGCPESKMGCQPTWAA